MDFIASPLLTVVINVIAQYLVSKGLLDQSSRYLFVQALNNTLISVGSAAVGIYSIYKIIELHKHKITVSAGGTNVTMSSPANTASPVSIPPVN